MPLSDIWRAATFACIVFAVVPAMAQSRSPVDEPSVLTDEQTRAIERLIRNYIVQLPDVLLEAQATLEARAEAQRIDIIRKHLAENQQAIYRDPSLPVAGNRQGDVTIVEFLDYSCPYCKRAVGDIAKLIATDKNVKVVFQEFANFGAASEAVAYIAVAANRQGKYYDLHRAFLEKKGQMTEAKALEIAGRLGLDAAQLKRDAALAETKDVVAKARALAAKLSIQGTPMFLIGDRYIAGVPDNFYEELTRTIAEVRKTGCKVC